MVGCFVGIVAAVVGLSLVPFLGGFITSYFTSVGYDFSENWSLLEGVIGLFGFGFIILIIYAMVRSVRG